MSIGRLSLGTAQLGMPYGIANQGAALSDGQATGVLQAAVDLGISCLDTAPDYGVAEQRIGAFLAEHDLFDEISICTKLPSLGQMDTLRAAQQVEERLTGSLRRLRSECIDSYLIHDLEDLRRHGDALVSALVEQRDKGRVVDIGVSVHAPEDTKIVEEYPELNVVQHPFNLLDRRLLGGDWPNWLAARGTKLQVRSVLLQGLLALEPDGIPAAMPEARAAVERLRRILESFDADAPAVAVAFALALDPDRVVIAADSATQLEELVAAADNELPDGLREALDNELDDLPPSVIDPRTWPSA
jgi:aryl-alcohol dehydrogenase-like predicted oxidoreductase